MKLKRWCRHLAVWGVGKFYIFTKTGDVVNGANKDASNFEWTFCPVCGKRNPYRVRKVKP